MILLLHATVVSVVRTDLRTDGVPVMLMEPGQLEAEMELHSKDAVVSAPFSAAFVERALKEGVDWRDKGAGNTE